MQESTVRKSTVTNTNSNPLPREARAQRPSSLGSQIAAGLREAIVLGRLSAGTRVSQEKLCKQYGTSRMPVRDALLRLSQEGLIEVAPTGQYLVARLTTMDVADAFEVEALVHGRAARRATMYASVDDIEALAHLCDEMDEAEEAGDVTTVAALHWRFHRQINILARSPKLKAVSRNVSVGIPPAYLRELPEWVGRANRAHRKILDAMVRRDANEAEALVRELIERSGEDLVAFLEQRGLLPAPSRVERKESSVLGDPARWADRDSGRD